MVKKYHVADLLTASRYFFAAVIILLTITAAPPVWVLAIFVIGELTDAADGPASSRWPYPDEWEKRLWWRVHKVVFDMAADMALGIAALIYVAAHTYAFGRTLCIVSIMIGTISQLMVVYVLPPPDRSLFTKGLILLRRALLYIPAIAAVMIMLLLKATVPGELTWEAISRSDSLKVWLSIGAIIGAVLFYLKRDRVVEVARRIKGRDIPETLPNR